MASYGTLCTEFYDLDKPHAPARALAFYIRRAREAGGRILEPMSGSGRFLLPMRQSGLLVDGVDSSPAMLQACRAHARRLGIDVNLHLQDLSSLALPSRYAMAFIPSGSIGLITDGEALRRSLTRVHSHLHPGGVLFLEIVDQSETAGVATELEPRTVRCPDGSAITYSCVVSRSPDSGEIRFAGTYTKREGVRVVATEVEEIALRVYGAARLSAELAACGFKSPRIHTASELTFLAESGCTLLEARA